MRPPYYILLLAFTFIFQNSYSQETCTALSTGTWSGGNPKATWDCPGSADLATTSKVIIPNGVELTIQNNVTWNADVVVQSGGKIIFTNQLNLGQVEIGCGYTLIIEGGGEIYDEGNNSSNRLFICGQPIISSQPNPAPAISWGDGFLGPTGFDELGEFDPLPVELLGFEATTQQNQTTLAWSTASEQDNDFFTLEKSKNGIDFVKIGRVSGNGTTNLVSNYSFADNSPYLGLSYYKLSQTDYDGTTESFPAISIVSMNQDISFNISPNPVSNSFAKLKVSQKAKNELLELNIIDLQGKLIQKKYFKTDQFGNVETEFELKNQVQKGTYIFELVSAHNREYLKVIGN